MPILEIHRHSSATPWTYSDLDRRQREVALKIREEDAPGVLILSELAPVITLGRRARAETLKLTPAEFEQKGIEILAADRGGLETYHGPGQWVVFAVERLDRITGDPRGLKEAVCRLLHSAKEVALKYRHDAEIKEGAHLGVWSQKGKFASLGVHLEGGVLLHGMSLNGFRTETSFLGLNPCGLDVSVDFLLENPLEFETLGQELVNSVKKHFWKLG